MQTTVVYRHPKGRFEVRETVGKSALGGTYRIREAFLTPQKDARGTFSRKERPPVIAAEPESRKGKPKDMRGGARKKLTDEEKTWIRRLFADGMTMRQIAKEIGRTDTVVRSYLTDEAQLRKPRQQRAWTDEDREKARQLYASGMTLHQVGQAMGRTFSSVKHAMEKKTG